MCGRRLVYPEEVVAMSGTDKKNKESTENRALWLRSQATEVPDDAAERFLDLAAFADARLEGEEAERVAALLAADPDAASDVAAARSPQLALADDVEIARVIARACALVPPPAGGRRRVLPLPRPARGLGAGRGGGGSRAGGGTRAQARAMTRLRPRAAARPRARPRAALSPSGHWPRRGPGGGGMGEPGRRPRHGRLARLCDGQRCLARARAGRAAEPDQFSA